MKILVISEALGEPNHKRGIFHFTRELIRSLAAEGHDLTLLVETTRRCSASIRTCARYSRKGCPAGAISGE